MEEEGTGFAHPHIQIKSNRTKQNPTVKLSNSKQKLKR